MTLTQSKSKNDGRFLRNLLLSIKRNKKVLIFISVLQALGVPVMAAVGTLEIADKFKNLDVPLAFIMISIFCFGTAVLCGIFTALKNFSYLYQKSQADMVYALPIKRTDKFSGDYLAGLAVYVIPYILACIIGDLIFIFSAPELIDEGKNFISQTMPLILQLEFAGLLIMVMLYTLSVLVICCCGSMLETIMNIFMINVVIPGAIAVIAVMFFSYLYGVPIFDTMLPVMGYTSPAGAIIYGIYLIGNTNYYEVYCIDGAIYGKWVAFFLLCIVAYFLLSLFLYKKRKAEDVSKPYVYKLLYYILVTVIVMALSLISKFENGLIIPVIIFSFIVYMIFEVITNRGFKKIYMSIIKFAATSIGVFALSALASYTHGFGIEGRTYSPSMVKSVGVGYGGIDDFMSADIYFGENYFWDEGDTIEYSDKEIIEKMIEIQKQSINDFRSGKYETFTNVYDSGYLMPDIDDDKYSQDLYSYPVYDVTFKFSLVSGGMAVRHYTLGAEQMMQLTILDNTEEMADYKTEEVMKLVDEKSKGSYVIRYTPIKHLYRYNNIYNRKLYGDKYITEELTREEVEEFSRCYRADCLETTVEELIDSKVLCYIADMIPIRECFKNTLNFLSKHGGEDIISGMAQQEIYVTGVLYGPNDYKSWGRDDITATFGYTKTTNSYHDLTNVQTQELLKYAKPYCIENNDCYVMKIGDIYYVIPYEYNDLAKKIYNESPVKTEETDQDENLIKTEKVEYVE